jgi:hypothetical protein
MTRLSDQPCTCTHSTVGEGTGGGCPREDECYARWLTTRPEQCPTCGSGAPHLHPAMQADGGEVQPCGDSFHSAPTPENRRYLTPAHQS